VTTYSQLLGAETPDLAAIATHLDGLSFVDCLAQVRELSGRQVGHAYEVAAANGTIGLAHLVPDSCPAGEPVRHHGLNSLPLARRFEKRFVRSPDRDAELWGYNHQPMAWFTGPGYFVVRPADEGELFIDYREIPPQQPIDWPALKKNTSGITTLVYGHMQDYMRRVSDRVSVGRAFKKGKDIGQSFLLVREG
jgi:hypothetical protein